MEPADYDEEEDGFAFSRTRSKKAKAEAEKIPEAVEQQSLADSIKPIHSKRSRKKSHDPPDAAVKDVEKVEKRRRSARNSGGQTAVKDVEPVEKHRRSERNSEEQAAVKDVEPVEKHRRSARNSGEQLVSEPPPIQVKKRRPKEPKPVDSTTSANAAPSVDVGTMLAPEEMKPTAQVERSFDATKIALPFADTPIIRRNKEMRKGVGDGHRRSSLGNRGRRASSLIESGKSNGMELLVETTTSS